MAICVRRLIVELHRWGTLLLLLHLCYERLKFESKIIQLIEQTCHCKTNGLWIAVDLRDLALHLIQDLVLFVDTVIQVLAPSHRRRGGRWKHQLIERGVKEGDVEEENRKGKDGEMRKTEGRKFGFLVRKNLLLLYFHLSLFIIFLYKIQLGYIPLLYIYSFNCLNYS